MKTAVVTGANGQMGSCLIDFLLDKNIHIVGTKRLTSSQGAETALDLLAASNPNVTAEILDLGDQRSINSVIDKYKPDYFINCAATTFVGSSWDCPENYFQYNTLGVLRQLEAIAQFSKKTRYLNFGSSEEFGDVQTTPQDETTFPRARNPYGASKISARQIVQAYRQKYNLFAIQPWCYNYESVHRPEMFVTRKISKGIARIKKAIEQKQEFKPIELGNLDTRRDWSHVNDFVDATWLMINHSEPKDYILSSGTTHSIRDFLTIALKIAGLEYCISGRDETETFLLPEYLMDISHLKSRLLVQVNPKFYRRSEEVELCGDCFEIAKDLGWSPSRSFESIVLEMVKEDGDKHGVYI